MAAKLQPALASAGSWAQLSPGLSDAVGTALVQDLGFTAMTPVQAATIPLLLTHKDVAVEVRPLLPAAAPRPSLRTFYVGSGGHHLCAR